LVTIYRDIKLRLNPSQWAQFTVPQGFTVVWDKYNFKDKTVVGRFTVSENHLNPNERHNEIAIQKLVDSLGEYVISDNATNQSLKDVPFGEYTVTMEGHPYLKDLPKSVDVKRSSKEKDTKRFMSKLQIHDINSTIIDNAERFRELKKFRDERFKPTGKSNNKGEIEVYTAVLQELP